MEPAAMVAEKLLPVVAAMVVLWKEPASMAQKRVTVPTPEASVTEAVRAMALP